MTDIEVQILGPHSTRADLMSAITLISREASTLHPSPRLDDLHQLIDTLLGYLEGAGE